MLKARFLAFRSSKIFTNSFWGVGSNVVINLFLGLFFIILARKFSTEDFAHFLVANTLYQFVASFSTLGLGQWLIREMEGRKNRTSFIKQFLKLQLFLGAVFFLVNLFLTFALYEGYTIHLLSILLGINIVFDNLIYSIKFINIEAFDQKKTFLVLGLEAFLKLTIGCLLFLYPFSVFFLISLLIIVRFFTLNLFLKMSSTQENKLNSFLESKLSWPVIKDVILTNWSFVVIGGVSITYWRVANIIVAKKLELLDVANYEIAFKLFTIAQIVPMAIAVTVFPNLNTQYTNDNLPAFRKLYRKFFNLYIYYGLFAFISVYSLAEPLLPFAFGDTYEGAIEPTTEMFLTMLVFPTGFLQANVLVAMKLEKYDMWFNIISLILNVAICLIGLAYVESLSVVTLSLFVSFTVFHLLQDIILIRKGVTDLKEVIIFYVGSGAFVYGFYYLLGQFGSQWIYFCALLLLLSAFALSTLGTAKLKNIFIGIDNKKKHKP